jgi:hypothetical protein
VVTKDRRQDPYEVLGVSPDAPDEVIRAAYRALATKYHPDRNLGDRQAELKLKRVNAAWAVLGDPVKRQQYDEFTHRPEGDDEPVASEHADKAPSGSAQAGPEPRTRQDTTQRTEQDERARANPYTCSYCGARLNNRATRCSVCLKRQGDVSAGRGASTATPPSTISRVLLGCGSAALSLYINVSRDENGPATIGAVLGCSLLAVFVYWLSGRIGLMLTGAGVTVLAVVGYALHEDQARKRENQSSASPATTPVARTAQQSAPAPPPVPSLLLNELPPSEGLNYFDPREMSSGGVIAGFASCQSAAHKSGPTLGSEQIAAYCTCTIDAMRRNFHATGDAAKATPTTTQLQTCGSAVQSGSQYPFAYTAPKSTADIWTAWNGCIRTFGDKDHGVYCDCFVDATLAGLKSPQAPPISLADNRRCEIADQYWAATKTHLTVRQFKLLAVE